MPRTPRAAAKGVEFSDEPIILGAPASSTAAAADHSPSIYQSHHSSEPHLHISPTDVVLRPPGKRRARFHSEQGLTLNHVDEPLETSCTDSDASASIPSSPLHPIAKQAFLAAQYDGTPQNEKLVEQSTRINTKLNSMPSGGAFSFMNSSEDIVSDSLDTSDSDTETDSSTDDDLRSSRRMIRVDGSAKLSSASGLNDDDFLDDDDDDDDEFGIEGAERVDEEEDIQVRSFGRSFARVSLKDGEDVIIRDPRKKDGARSEVAFALPGNEEDGGRRRSSSVRVPDRPRPLESDCDSGLQGMNTSRSDPPRRKSRMRMTFNKRAATANAVKNAQRKSMERNSIDRTSVDRTSVDRDGVARPSIDCVLATRSMQPDVDMSSDTDSDIMTGSCFPSRKGTASRRRTRSSTPNVKPGTSVGTALPQQDKSKLGGWGRKKSQAAGQLVSPPDMSNMVEGRRRHPSPERKIVKNVSLQKDDWIDFATNAARSQRHPWLVRVLSTNRMPSPAKKQTIPIAAQTDQDMTRKKSKRFWRVFSRKSK